MKNKIAKWYKLSLWTAEMVQNAVDKDIITDEDYAEIVGEEEEVE